jgi:hypothetical protein
MLVAPARVNFVYAASGSGYGDHPPVKTPSADHQPTLRGDQMSNELCADVFEERPACKTGLPPVFGPRQRPQRRLRRRHLVDRQRIKARYLY